MCTLFHTWAGHPHGYNNVLGSTFCTAYTIFHHQLNLSVQFRPPNVASSDSFLCYYDSMFFMQFAFVCSSTMAEWWHAFLTRLILGQLLAHACVWSRVSGLYQIHNFASWLGGSSKKTLANTGSFLVSSLMSFVSTGKSSSLEKKKISAFFFRMLHRRHDKTSALPCSVDGRYSTWQL